jgi:hypothetical protein
MPRYAAYFARHERSATVFAAARERTLPFVGITMLTMPLATPLLASRSQKKPNEWSVMTRHGNVLCP